MAGREKLDIIISLLKSGDGARQAANELQSLGIISDDSTQKLGRVRVEQENLSDSVRRSASNYDSAESELQDYNQELERTETNTRNASNSTSELTDMLKKRARRAFGGMAAEVKAAQLAVDGFKRGAELDTQARQFENLAASIGTTADKLKTDMRQATAGLMSDASLISAANDLISLGLAKSNDEVVRLANVAGRLNLDMQILGLTLANDSTARLDSLGVSIESVREKTERLKSEGFTGDVFDAAVIEALEDRVKLLGDATETAEGRAQKLAAAWQNVKDKLAQNWTSFISPLIFDVSDMIDTAELRRQLNDLGISNSALTQMVLDEFGGIAPDYNALGTFYQGILDDISGLSNASMEDFFATQDVLIDESIVALNSLGDAYFDAHLQKAKLSGDIPIGPVTGVDEVKTELAALATIDLGPFEMMGADMASSLKTGFRNLLMRDGIVTDAEVEQLIRDTFEAAAIAQIVEDSLGDVFSGTLTLDEAVDLGIEKWREMQGATNFLREQLYPDIIEADAALDPLYQKLLAFDGTTFTATVNVTVDDSQLDSLANMLQSKLFPDELGGLPQATPATPATSYDRSDAMRSRGVQ